MSRAPHSTLLRQGLPFAHGQLVDCLMHDGLTDSFSGNMMGILTEKVIKDFGFTREQLDEVAVNSYKNAIQAQKVRELLIPEGRAIRGGDSGSGG